MKATPDSLRARCNTALQSLPDAQYKTMLAALFDDLLAGRIAAQSAPTDYPGCSGDPSSCPENEGHGCCKAVTQSAPLQQAAREYPPLPDKVYLGDDVSYGYDSESLRDYVDADRAAAQVEPRGTDAQILFERKLTCEAVQGAMAFGYQGKNPPPTDADHWLQPFWDIGNRTRQLEQAAALSDFHRIMAMPEAEVDAELRSLGIDPDKAAERADRAIKGALAGAQVEPVRMLTEEEPEKCYSLDEENFHDFGDFMDMLDEDQCKPGLLVFEGDSVRHTASHYACGAVADMFERMAEQAFDEAGEHIGDWPDHAVKGERLAELERLIFDWLDANVKVHFYTVKNVREIALTAEMIGDDAGIIPADGEVRK